jgi:threonine/homoserine/homoserine lactone efflux protein
MFAHMIDRFKEKAGSTLQLTSLAAAIAMAGSITLAFLCAAGFIYVLQTYGPIQACLTCAGIFLLVAVIAASLFVARRNRAEEEAQARKAEAARSAVHTALADPMLVAAGIQVVRAIGVKRLIPILAVGGLALGLLASRHASADEAPAE